jgi:hypothetical protein
MPVASTTQLMIHRLLSYTQHYCDFATGLPVARSLSCSPTTWTPGW